MATANETKTAEKIKEKAPKDREEIFIPKGYANEEPNMIVGVNGVNYILPRGKTSMVPPFVAAEVRRSMKAQDALDERVEQMLEASK